MLDRVELLNHPDMREYFAQYIPQANTQRPEITVCSPFRQEKNPSFSLDPHKGLWIDHATGESGNAVSFEQKMSNCDLPTALENINRFIAMQPDRRKVTYVSNQGINQHFGTSSDVTSWGSCLFNAPGFAARAYLNSRGISDETLKRYSVGYNDKLQAITLPLAFEDNHITSLKLMFFQGSGWRLRNGKKDFRNHGPAILYCAEHVKSADTVLVCEGELDCLLLRQYGFDAVTGTSGAGTWKKSWNYAFQGKHVVFIFDSDPAGIQGALRAAEEVFPVARSVRIAKLFPSYKEGDKEMKDVTDFFRIGRSLEELRALLDCAEPYESQKAPLVETKPSKISYVSIADEILEDHALIHLGGSYYAYQKGVWHKDRGRLVDKLIMDRCGKGATPTRIQSINWLLALKCNKTQEDLTTDACYLNFPNGLFNLKTMALEHHSTGLFTTIQFPFEYIESAQCPRWLRFVDEVFEGNQSLGKLLQEVFGYVLVPDTSMQKMFWFVGEGANGKGVALKVLEALVDKSNRTTVDIRNLQNPFVRAALHNKLLALQGDFPRKFFNNEDLVKAIVGGDTVDAQEKFGPQFEFTPYCRFIFAMNELPETKDLSKGFFRRVVIVPFARTFEESEQDRGLEEKLRSELPGILRWALEGLKRLVNNKQFTESPDAMMALENYRQDHNPIGQFVESECVLGPDTKCKVSDLWSTYETFCMKDGLEPLGRKFFAINLKKQYPVSVRTHRWADEPKPSRTYFGIAVQKH